MNGTWWRLLPEPARRFPADLAATIGLTLATALAVGGPAVRETPLRVALGLPFVLFLPGYAFVALLFPERGDPPGGADGEGSEGDGAPGAAGEQRSRLDPPPGRERGIDGVERAALSFGLSIAVVPLIGLGLNYTPWGIRLTPILLGVGGFTVGCSIGAAYRRWELPPEERFRVPYRAWLAAAREELLEPEDRTDAALNVLVAASLLLAVGSVGYAVAAPPQGERFTEFYVLTEDDGRLVADDYPEELRVGEPHTLTVGVGNQEHERVEYTVVVQLQRAAVENNETEVLERRELDRYRTTLDHNQTRHRDHSITPTMAGEELRLQYLLYRGDPPDEITAETAYRDLQLWVDVRG